jgi:hypothetical protein
MRAREMVWWDNWARLDPEYSPAPYTQLGCSSLLGALYLRTRVNWVRDNYHGFAWCFGASLTRLLPVIEINKEFTEFFNDPTLNQPAEFYL